VVGDVSDNDCRQAALVNRTLSPQNGAGMLTITQCFLSALKKQKKKTMPRNDFMLVAIAPGPRVW
jgi:hypothetical protein